MQSVNILLMSSEEWQLILHLILVNLSIRYNTARIHCGVYLLSIRCEVTYVRYSIMSNEYLFLDNPSVLHQAVIKGLKLRFRTPGVLAKIRTIGIRSLIHPAREVKFHSISLAKRVYCYSKYSHYVYKLAIFNGMRKRGASSGAQSQQEEKWTKFNKGKGFMALKHKKLTRPSWTTAFRSN